MWDPLCPSHWVSLQYSRFIQQTWHKREKPRCINNPETTEQWESVLLHGASTGVVFREHGRGRRRGQRSERCEHNGQKTRGKAGTRFKYTLQMCPYTCVQHDHTHGKNVMKQSVFSLCLGNCPVFICGRITTFIWLRMKHYQGNN